MEYDPAEIVRQLKGRRKISKFREGHARARLRTLGKRINYMETIEQSIEVDAPVSMVYNQWTQFEEFPRFMEGVKSVHQLDDTRMHWHAEIARKDKEWDAEIVEQRAHELIMWRSTTGAHNAGEVHFDKTSGGKTKVTLVMTYEPEGIVENVGDALGLVSMRVKGDLKRFEKFLDSRRDETGAWRGEIHGGKVES
ncbi:MAG: SRPBCC family protein [Chthoniobacterales bacterium]